VEGKFKEWKSVPKIIGTRQNKNFHRLPLFNDLDTYHWKANL
jgi:hypothetical protein